MTYSNAVTAVLEDAANRLLRLDPDTLRRLGDIQGKVICLRIHSHESTDGPVLHFFPSEGGLQIRPHFDGPADVTIAGNPPAFLRLFMGEHARGAFTSGQMQISGDLELGQRFQMVLKKLDIDREEVMARYVGDAAAHRIGHLAREFRQWRHQARATLRLDTREYLQEEIQVLPRADHVDELLGEIDRFRSDIDRLEKRIQRLLGVGA